MRWFNEKLLTIFALIYLPFLSKLIFCTKDLWLCVNKESWGKVVPSKRKIPIEQTCNINIFSQQQETFVITKTQTTYDDSHYLHFVSKMINCKLTKNFFEVHLVFQRTRLYYMSHMSITQLSDVTKNQFMLNVTSCYVDTFHSVRWITKQKHLHRRQSNIHRIWHYGHFCSCQTINAGSKYANDSCSSGHMKFYVKI